MTSTTFARYGKDNVRICQVERNEETGVHVVTEMNVCVLLEGAIISSFTHADNSVIVATDSIKNTIYIKAREHSVNPPELFASLLGYHFLEEYPHVTDVTIKIITYRWTRMNIEGRPHPHSFYRDGADTRNTIARIQKGRYEIKSGINDLTIFKSTGSQFHGFIRDDFTTLPEVRDRILSTDVNCFWTWKPFENINEVKKAVSQFNQAWLDVRRITMKIFSQENSPSVQNTMYKMCTFILQNVSGLQDVEFKLPNKHYNIIDLSWCKRLQNTGKNIQVYLPQTDPNGLIELKVLKSRVPSKL